MGTYDYQDRPPQSPAKKDGSEIVVTEPMIEAGANVIRSRLGLAGEMVISSEVDLKELVLEVLTSSVSQI